MLKMLKKKTIWSQKKVTHIKKERERVGEEEVCHAPIGIRIKRVYLLV
jgi:hypothetical protein